MTAHIDQLNEWYESAERITKTNLPNKGDTLIYPRRTSGYIIESDGGGWAPELVHSTGEAVRILARAPKPNPAWHDAVAVIASTDNLTRQVWERDGDGWYGTDGYRVDTEALEDVTPLIEAKVTDEMVTRAQVEMMRLGLGDYSDRTLASILTAALGLETA